MIGVRVCRWGRLCGWSGFFFLAEASSEDLTGFDLESDGAWSPEEATIPAVLHCLPSSLLLCGYVWGGFSLGVVARAYELPVAARGEFLRLHLRLIGELRLPESSSGLWQRAGLSLSRNKGVIFGSVVSAKEVQSGGCGLGLVWYLVFLLVRRSSLSEEVCLICLTAFLVWWVKRVYTVPGLGGLDSSSCCRSVHGASRFGSPFSPGARGNRKLSPLTLLIWAIDAALTLVHL
ncbi:hypothetical protein Bca4012_034024 [Brassica carinata]